MKTKTRQEIAECIFQRKNNIFRVDFIKKSTGELRTMTCRLGVKKFLKGGEKAYSDKEKGLITVCEMSLIGDEEAKSPYRCFAIENIVSAKVDGVEMMAV